MTYTEVDINNFLQKGRQLADRYEKQNKKEIADRIIQVTSLVALRVIDENKLNDPVVCNTCHKTITNAIDRDFTREFGECLGCDKIRGDILLDNAIEGGEMYED